MGSNNDKRVILSMDVDCFECQLWIMKKRPDLVDKDVPVIVVSPRPHSVILSVNYSAKAKGISRDGQGKISCQELHRKFPNLVILETSQNFGFADDFVPFVEADKILQAVESFRDSIKEPEHVIIERRSGGGDNIFVDVTKLVDNWNQSETELKRDLADLVSYTKSHPNLKYLHKPYLTLEGNEQQYTRRDLKDEVWFILNVNSDYCHTTLRLLKGTIVAHQLVQAIYAKTKFEVSIGVGENKLLARLAVDLNKPQGICIVTVESFARITADIPIRNLPGFKGAIGEDLMHWYFSKYRETMMVKHARKLSSEVVEKVFTDLRVDDPAKWTRFLSQWSHGQDDTLLTAQVFPESMRGSVNLSGYRGCFGAAVQILAIKFLRKLQYCAARRQESPSLLTVSFHRASKKKCDEFEIKDNQLSVEQGKALNVEDVIKFVVQVAKQNGLNKRNVSRIILRVPSFHKMFYFEDCIIV